MDNIPASSLILFFPSQLCRSLCAIGKGCKRLKSLSLNICQILSDLGLDSIAVGCAELMCLEVLQGDGIGIGGLKSIAKACT